MFPTVDAFERRLAGNFRRTLSETVKMLDLDAGNPLADAVVHAIHNGDVDGLTGLLRANPGLAQARIGSRSLLHLAADWPGHFPNGAAVVTALIAAGADPNARGTGRFPETPLHWAASSNDVEVLDALLDGGADIEAAGASIAGGTALDDAVGYGQWQAARRLVERGAKVSKLWHAAALGIMDILEEQLAGSTRPAPEAVNDAFWQACHGGQRAAAEYLLARGADKNWIPSWAKQTPLDIAVDHGAYDLVKWLHGQGAQSAQELRCGLKQ
jgi:ankyrin repeat protein